MLRSPRRVRAAVAAGAALSLPLVVGLTGVAQAAPDVLSGATATFQPLPGAAVGPVGDYPSDVAVAPGGGRALVVDRDHLAQLDVSHDRPTVTGRNAAIVGSVVAYHPNGTTAYVLDDEQLTVVDTTGAVPQPVRALRGITPSAASAIAVSPDGRWAYVAYGELGGPSGVRVLSLATPRTPVEAGTIATEPFPVDVDVSRDGTRLVTTQSGEDAVGLFDVSHPAHPRTVVRKLPVPFSTGASVFSPDGATVYLWGDEQDEVGTLDWGKRLVTRTRSLGTAKGGPDVVLSHDGRFLFAVCDQDTDATGAVVVNTSTLALTTTFTGLSYSRGLAESPGGPSADRTFFLSSGSEVYGTRAFLYPVQRH